MLAKCMQLSREVEEVKPPGGGNRNIESSRHRRVFSLGSLRFPLIRVAASNRGDPGAGASRHKPAGSSAQFSITSAPDAIRGNSSQKLITVSSCIGGPAQFLAIGFWKKRQSLAGAPTVSPFGDCAGERAGIVVGHERDAGGERGRVREIGAAGPVRANKRQTTGHGLGEHIPKSVFAGGQHENVGRRIKSSQLGLRRRVEMKEPLIAGWKI